MSGVTITDDQFDLLVAAVEDEGLGEVRTDYSGRWMFGDECIGIDLASVTDFSVVLLNVAARDREFAYALADAERSDSMGFGVIVYFPGVKAPERDEDDE